MKQLFICIILLISSTVSAQSDHWESVVLPGDHWNYIVPTSQPPIEWKTLEFAAQGWEQGPSGIGYGDGDDATEISTTLSVYLTHQFNIIDLSDISSVALHMDYDDGFVAYINGEEVARELVSGEVPAFDQPSDGLHEASLYRGMTPESWLIDTSSLVEGQNVIAVEVHNQSTTSSDMSAIPVVSLGIQSETFEYRPTPDWFVPPAEEIDFVSSNLPIVVINTNGQEIPDEPKIDATMTIIYREGDDRNYLANLNNQDYLNYNGDIKIEFRGATSSILPKKPFGFTTYSPSGEKLNVSLLDMPSENDWQLNSLAFDPSLMRDYISYRLAEKTGHYASRGRYCEVILNGSYHGLYILQEKLKVDKDRVDIKKIEPQHNDGKQVTGGYITKSDKTEGQDLLAWNMTNGTRFIHEHPRPTEVTSAQNEYIKSVFFDLQDNARNNSITSGYPSIIDVPSFIDFMLVCELSSNVDAYQFSTYFHKDRNGKLRAGPVWDFNLTYGNDLFELIGADRSKTDVWQMSNGDNEGARFWRELFFEPNFNCYLTNRWNQLIQPGQPFHPESIDELIDETVELISEAKDREENRWRTIGDHDSHIIEMKNWIRERIDWMSDQLGSAASCQGEEVPNLAITKIHYHPKSIDGTGEKDLEFIEITNLENSSVDVTGIYFGRIGLVYQFPSGQFIEAGESVYLANENDAFEEAYGFAPYDEFSRSLSNAGQEILLLNAMGNVVDQVTYLDESPWPTSADGDGDYLSLINPSLDNNDPSNWEALSFETILSTSTVEPVLKIYPNPVVDRLYISSKSSILQVQVIDLIGRTMISEKRINEEVVELNVSQLDPGIYHILIHTPHRHYNRKIKIRD